MMTIKDKELLYDMELSQIVLQVTGLLFTFATAQGRYLGSADKFDRNCTTYQLMPETINGLDFFNWYCDTRPYDQFFLTKEECVTALLKYWFIYKKNWQEIGQD